MGNEFFTGGHRTAWWMGDTVELVGRALDPEGIPAFIEWLRAGPPEESLTPNERGYAALVAATIAPIGVETTLRTGVGLISAERERQVTEEDWTPEHDDYMTAGALSKAAAVYAVPALYALLWPFDDEAYKPSTRIRDLTKAGALIAAELDRLLRLLKATP